MNFRISVKPSFALTLKASIDLSESVADAVLVCQVEGLILSLPNGQYCSRVLNEHAWEQLIPLETAQLIRQTAACDVTAAPNFAFGIDGTSFTVEVTSGFNTALYRWWGKTPVGWEPLDKILLEVVRISRVQDVMQIYWSAA